MALRFLHGKSQAEVGRLLGVSQMFVSRAERKIVEKLNFSEAAYYIQPSPALGKNIGNFVWKFQERKIVEKLKNALS